MRLDLEMLDKVLIRSALGTYPDNIEFEWNPLYQKSSVEEAQEDLADAQADAINIENRIIRPSHAMTRAQAKGRYAITDEQIAAQVQREKDEDNGLGSEEDLEAFTLGGPGGDEQGADGEKEKAPRTGPGSTQP